MNYKLLINFTRQLESLRQRQSARISNNKLDYCLSESTARWVLLTKNEADEYNREWLSSIITFLNELESNH